MNDRRQRALLYALAAVMLTSAALFVDDQPREEPPPLSRDTVKVAERLALHPTDWRASNVLSESMLEGDSPRRIQQWRAAATLSVELAPHFEAARQGFIRGGLFHWYELGDSERRDVLDELAPLLRDPAIYYRVAQPIFELTGDLSYLRRYQPRTMDTVDGLRTLAVTNGRFEDYRELRAELTALRTQQLPAQFQSLPSSKIVAALPVHPTMDDEPVLAAALRKLQAQPLEVDCGRADILDALIDYAVRHRLGPLTGLAHVVDEKNWASSFARAELARALGDFASAQATDPREVLPPHGEVLTVKGVAWDGACGALFCRSALAQVNGPLTITIENGRSDEVPPYVECYIDDARVWEGPIARSVTLPLVPAGRHRVEIMLANPLTRNRAARAIRIS